MCQSSSVESLMSKNLPSLRTRPAVAVASGRCRSGCLTTISYHAEPLPTLIYHLSHSAFIAMGDVDHRVKTSSAKPIQTSSLHVHCHSSLSSARSVPGGKCIRSWSSKKRHSEYQGWQKDNSNNQKHQRKHKDHTPASTRQPHAKGGRPRVPCPSRVRVLCNIGILSVGGHGSKRKDLIVENLGVRLT